MTLISGRSISALLTNGSSGNRFAVSADGQRFVISISVRISGASASPLQWIYSLKAASHYRAFPVKAPRSVVSGDKPTEGRSSLEADRSKVV